MGDKKSSSDSVWAKLITPKGVIRFFCVFLLVFGLLMAPWPRLDRAYAGFYKTGAAFLFGSFGSKGVVRFGLLSDREHDISVTLYNRALAGPDGSPAGIQTHHNCRHAGYMYAAFLIALILATPISARRKGWALLCGMILVHGFAAATLALRLFHAFSNRPLSVFALSPLGRRVLSVANQAFAVNVTFGFIVCVFIWLLVSFRPRDWADVVRRGAIHQK